MTRLTAENESAIRALEAAATPGPWVSGTEPEDSVHDEVRVCFFRDGQACEWCVALSGETTDGEHWTEETLKRWRADADFIAASRQAVPALLAEIGAVRMDQARLAGALRSIATLVVGDHSDAGFNLSNLREAVSVARAALDK